MRDAKEIERLLTALQNEQINAEQWDGDNFKYGMYLGKMLALEWAKGEVSTGEMGVHYDHDDYMQRLKDSFEELREKISRPKPSAASDVHEKQERPHFGGTNTIRLDHSRLLKIEADNSIAEQVALADVITARTHSNEREQCLFKRSKEEIEAFGRSYKIQTLQFSVQNVKDLRHLTAAIARMKQEE
jgi:hypothetical protein